MASKSNSNSTRKRTTTSRASRSTSARTSTLRSKVEGRRGQLTAAIKQRPYTSIAATLAAGAGLAAFFLARRERPLPLKKWGQQVEEFAGQVEQKVKKAMPRKDGIDLDTERKTEIKTGAIAY